MSDLEFRFQYTPTTARRAFLASLWDGNAVYIVMSLLMGIACALELKNAEVRPLACFGLGVIAMLWWSWLNAYRWSRHLASAVPSAETTVKLSSAGIEFHAGEAMSRLSWAALRSVVRFKHVWLFEQRVSRIRRAVPVAALSSEAKDLIVRMVSAAGGAVR